MKTILAVLAGIGITLFIVVYVMAGDEPPAAPAVQSQEGVSHAHDDGYTDWQDQQYQEQQRAAAHEYQEYQNAREHDQRIYDHVDEQVGRSTP